MTNNNKYKWLKDILKNLKNKNDQDLQDIGDVPDKEQHTVKKQQDDTSESIVFDIHPFFSLFIDDDFINNNFYEDPTWERLADLMLHHGRDTLNGYPNERRQAAQHLWEFFIKKFNSEASMMEDIWHEVKRLQHFLEAVHGLLPDKESKEYFWKTILDTPLTYGIIENLHDIGEKNPEAFQNENIRMLFKDTSSPFRMECMLAYLQKNEDIILKIEEIIKMALETKYSNDDSSSKFIQAIQNIELNTIANPYMPDCLIKGQPKNKNTVLEEEKKRMDEAFLKLLKL